MIRLLSFFARRPDGRAEPMDLATWWAEREASFARRKHEREPRTPSAKRGHSTRWAKAGAAAREMFGDPA